MIYIGADHRGYELKAKIARWLRGRQYEFEDMGAYEYDHSDDYVEIGVAVAQKVAQSPDKRWGIVICGSGVGMDVIANKVHKIRCGLGFSEDQVHEARKDDNINVLALPADNLEEEKALKLVEQFLETAFVETDRYTQRVKQIERYERLEN